MVVGFNHNFRYKGEVYHIQTEDSGVHSPNIVTLLYRGGTILSSNKTSYADIAKVNNLEQVVEELMKEQHKGMLRDLKAGDFDEIIARFEAGRLKSPAAAPAETAKAAAPAEPKPAEAKPAPAAAPASAPVAPPVDMNKEGAAVETSLDEVILSYLMGDGD
jgi:hypothetical protein